MSRAKIFYKGTTKKLKSYRWYSIWEDGGFIYIELKNSLVVKIDGGRFYVKTTNTYHSI